MNRISIVFVMMTAVATCQGQELTQNQVTFFETKIRPVLVASCYECHSKKTGQNEGGLTLDTKIGLHQGGNSGLGVTPHKLDESQIWLAVTHSDKDSRMPPKAELPAHVIADFKQWIEMGAPDPRNDGLPSVVKSPINIEKGREFWSFQKPNKTSPPSVEGEEWCAQ